MNSETITQRIWQYSKATGANKLMLLALAQYADKDGFCWPSYETLGAMTGLTGKPGSIKRNTIRNLAPVIESGEVMVWEQQGQHGGRGYSNIYLIVIGLTCDQIQEIIQRRFELQGDEVDTILSRKGDKYVTLCYLKRVTIEVLLRTKDAQKSDKVDTLEAEKGDKNITRTSLESYLEESNSNEESKGAAKNAANRRPPPVPAYQIFVEETQKWCLNNAQIKAIDREVGNDPPALQRWREAVVAWVMEGNKITNAAGILEWFRTGKRSSYNPNKNGATSNGHKRQPKQGPISTPQDQDQLRRIYAATLTPADDTD